MKKPIQSGRWLSPFIALLAVLLALIAANALSLRLHGPAYELNIGFRADRQYLAGFFDQEEDVRATRYRWTRAESTLLIDEFIAAPRPLLLLEIGGIPPGTEKPRRVQAAINGKPWTVLAVQPGARTYWLHLPPDTLRDGRLHFTMESATSRVPPDRRDVGIRLDSVEVRWSTDSLVLPTGRALLTQWAIVALALAGAWRLRFSRRSMALVAAGVIVLLAATTGYDPLAAATWHYRLLVASLAVLVLLWGAFPRLARLLPSYARHPAAAQAELRWLLVLTLLALGVRLLAALYPVFDSHDWYIHEERLMLFQHGSLLLFDKPAEFSNRVAIVPPAFYVLVAPFTLFTTNTVPTTHGVYTFLDGCSVLLLAIFVRQIGGSARAARLALLALAFFPIQFTALWWGFGPQVIGQALFLALVVFVAHRRVESPLLWIVAAVLFSVIILVHNGVALLGGFWLAGYVGLMWLFRRHERIHWLGWGAVAAASALIALVMLYSDVVALQLRGVSSNDRLAFTEEDYFRVRWTWESLYASFNPLNISLAFVCLGVTAAWARGAHRLLVLAWLASAGVFFAIDLRFGLQVRYAYFIMPLICTGLGVLLDRLAARHRFGWLVAGCIIGIIALTGLLLWYEGVVPAMKPSLRPLTH